MSSGQLHGISTGHRRSRTGLRRRRSHFVCSTPQDWPIDGIRTVVAAAEQSTLPAPAIATREGGRATVRNSRRELRAIDSICRHRLHDGLAGMRQVRIKLQGNRTLQAGHRYSLWDADATVVEAYNADRGGNVSRDRTRCLRRPASRCRTLLRPQRVIDVRGLHRTRGVGHIRTRVRQGDPRSPVRYRP